MANLPVARVKVERSGRILLDGRPVTLGAFRKSLAALERTKKHLRIRYYREGARTEASARALAAWQAVMDSDLPVELCDDEAQFLGDCFGPPKEEKPDDDVWWS